MSALYLWLTIGSISIPFLFSFYPKLKLYKLWPAIFLAIGCTMLIYIPWDIIFTQKKIWGFNEEYNIGVYFLNLPVEEWLFFICIPYACLFTHYALLYFFPNFSLKYNPTRILSYLLIALFSLLALLYYNRWYTVINFGYSAILTAFIWKKKPALLSKFYCTFIIILIPFFIVNGILTGSFINNEVVWYNNLENMNLRIYTIPVEDSIYAFTLLLTNLSLVEWFKEKLFR